MKMHTKIRYSIGFSLIELVIVVAIVAILASVAYPSYVEQIRKSKRSEAMQAALECAGIQERRYTINNDYDDTACDSLGGPLTDYQISVSHPGCQSSNDNDFCFVITVTAIIAEGQFNDTSCRTFTLDDKGNRQSFDAGGGTSSCWRQ